MKFTATRALRDKLEQARDWMRHANPSGEIAVVLERAVDLLLAELEKKQQGRTSRPQKKPRAANDTHVTRAARREVAARDGWRCSFVSEDGRRCNATAFVELDHETPRGRGGGPHARNLRVLCRAHNRLAAERVFGKAYVAEAISRSRMAGAHPDGAGFNSSVPATRSASLCAMDDGVGRACGSRRAGPGAMERGPKPLAGSWGRSCPCSRASER